jgi:tetratricopeptide (TPR) repeat protein
MAIGQVAASDASRESLYQSIEKARSSGQLPEAANLLMKAVHLDESTDGPSSRNVVEDRDMLSDVLSEDQKYSEAETKLKAAMAIYEVSDGPLFPPNPYYLGRLAELADHQQRFAEAEQFYKKVLAIQDKDQGAEDPATLRDLAKVYRHMRNYPTSEALYKMIIESQTLDPDSGEILGSVEDLSAVYEEEGKFAGSLHEIDT